MTTLEVTAFVFGVVSVFLSVRENIWSWPTAIVNVLLYFLVFRDAKLYADMGLQLVYFVLSIYGWYEWLHGGANRTALTVSALRLRTGLILAAIAVAFAVALGTLLARTTDAALPYLDAATASTSLAAQWMMTRKILQNWAVWMAVDVVYVGMYLFKGLALTAVLYAIFFVLAAMGHVQWKRSLAAQLAKPQRAAAT